MFQMDENLASIILAIISLISLIYAKKSETDKKDSAKKLEAKTAAFKKEKELREEIWKAKEETDKIKSAILISVLHSNTAMLKYAVESEDKTSLEVEAKELETKYGEMAERLRQLKERYAMLLEVAGTSIQEEKDDQGT